ncbi:MAG TPA: TolC family protein [Kofleriaceae bacterium]
MPRLAAAALAALAACAPSASELRAPVDRELAARLPESAGTIDIDAALAKPLDESAAVRIALASSLRLRADFDALGIAGGELATALGLGPLTVDAQLRFGNGGHELELDAIQSVLGLVLAPRQRAAARADLAAARARAAAASIRLVGRVQIAFAALLAAQAEIELRQTAFAAADAAATLRERMHAAGNTTDLALARDQDAREQASVDLARARADATVRRERLNALLGLSGARTHWTVTGELPPLPPAPPALDDLEDRAVAASLDLAAGVAHRDAAAARAGAARVSAWLPELGVGVSAIDNGDGLMIGPALRLGLPLFDQRSGLRARTRAELRQADDDVLATGVELRAAARAARTQALAADAEARHIHDVILPLRQKIVDETLAHFNAMDADAFQLVLARRQLVDGGHQYLDALRRYWSAMAAVHALERGTLLEEAP